MTMSILREAYEITDCQGIEKDPNSPQEEPGSVSHEAASGLVPLDHGLALNRSIS
jgi:hypothetical protein